MLIAVSQPHEVRYWSKKFKVTPARLKAAVKEVGHSSKKVGALFPVAPKSAKKNSKKNSKKSSKKTVKKATRKRAKKKAA